MVPAVAKTFANRRENVLPRMLRWETIPWNEKDSPLYKTIENVFKREHVSSIYEYDMFVCCKN